MATQATNPAFLTPDLVPSKDAMRQKMAYALLQQGSSGEPVTAWTQGLARMAQGALGGYELGKDAKEEREREATIAGALANMPGMGPPQDMPQAPPQAPPQQPLQPRPVQTQPQPPMAGRSPVVAALGQGDVPAPARPAIQPSARVVGDQEGVNAGIYPPNAAPVNGTVPAMTPNARVAQALGPTQTQAPNISQVDQEGIRNLWQNPATRPLAMERYQQLSKPKDQDVPLIDPKERAAAGIQPTDTNPYQRNMATGKISPINPQPFAVNVNQQGESEFSKETAKLQAKRFDELAGEAVSAKQMQSDVAMLRDLGEKIKTGKLAEVKGVIGPYADALGIKVDGLSEIQAFEAVVNRVAPNLRVKGSGAQSDFELRNFLKQMPAVGATPEGNEIIGKTFNGFIQNKLLAAEIGSQALTGEITRKDAEKRLRELPDPMKEWREFNKKTQTDAAPLVIDGYKIREKK